MPVQIARTAQQLDEARWRARAAADRAEAAGGSDDVADAVYEFARWVLGDDDEDPTLEWSGEYDEAEDE